MERELGGGGSGWGTHVHPWLIHVNVWQNLLQYFKVISLQLKQINILRGWDVLRAQHQNVYIILGETDHQPRLDA